MKLDTLLVRTTYRKSLLSKPRLVNLCLQFYFEKPALLLAKIWSDRTNIEHFDGNSLKFDWKKDTPYDPKYHSKHDG